MDSDITFRFRLEETKSIDCYSIIIYVKQFGSAAQHSKRIKHYVHEYSYYK